MSCTRTIDELEARKSELQKPKPKLTEPLSEFHENNGNITNLNPEVKQEDVVSMNDVLIPQPNMSIRYHHNKNETLHYSSPALLPLNEASSRTLIFDTKDLF